MGLLPRIEERLPVRPAATQQTEHQRALKPDDPGVEGCAGRAPPHVERRHAGQQALLQGGELLPRQAQPRLIEGDEHGGNHRPPAASPPGGQPLIEDRLLLGSKHVPADHGHERPGTKGRLDPLAAGLSVGSERSQEVAVEPLGRGCHHATRVFSADAGDLAGEPLKIALEGHPQAADLVGIEPADPLDRRDVSLAAVPHRGEVARRVGRFRQRLLHQPPVGDHQPIAPLDIAPRLRKDLLVEHPAEVVFDRPRLSDDDNIIPADDVVAG